MQSFVRSKSLEVAMSERGGEGWSFWINDIKPMKTSKTKLKISLNRLQPPGYWVRGGEGRSLGGNGVSPITPL